MNKKKTVLYAVLFGISVAVFISTAPVAALLTGGREFSEFTQRDIIIAIIAFVVGIASLVSYTVFLRKFIKATGKSNPQNQPKASRYDLIIVARTVLKVVAAVAITAILCTVGIVWLAPLWDTLWPLFAVLLFTSLAFVVIAVAVNIIGASVYGKKINSKSPEEIQGFLLSHKEDAEKTSQEKLVLLRKLIKLSDAYAILLALSGSIIVLFGAALAPEKVIPVINFTTIGFYVIYTAILRIRQKEPAAVFSDELYVSKEDYPQLYALAQRAADALSVKGDIKICVGVDFNAGIARMGNVSSVQLGAVMVSSLSEEELYTVFLHEFAHLAADENTIKEKNHLSWISNEKVGAILKLPFTFLDTYYVFQHFLYTYCSSVRIESEADRAMAELGDSKSAASALLKMHYYSLFTWERGTYDEEPDIARAELQADAVALEVERYRQRLEIRRDAWNALIDGEILARSASHPTLKMRLDALGHTDHTLTEIEDSKEYVEECERFRMYVEKLIFDEHKDSYAEERKYQYTVPCETLQKWEQAGKPLVAEEYGDVIRAMRDLGMAEEAYSLCDRAIAELPATASVFAYYIKGCMLLHRFDERGIEYIYNAIENNPNYIEEGLETIGQYCCTAGRQDDLDVYRARALELMKKQKDQYSEMDIIRRSDKLQTEKLEGDRLDELVQYIKSIDEGRIEEVYIVRKIITPEYFCSPVIVKLKKDLSGDDTDEVMHKLFSYLDTADYDWHFSLFDSRTVPMATVKKIPDSLIYKGQQTPK